MNSICRAFMEGSKCADFDPKKPVGENACTLVHDRNICKFLYFRGHCKKGEDCRFAHQVNGQPIVVEPNQNQNQHQNKNKNLNKNQSKKRRRVKNTETFEPSHEPVDMRVLTTRNLDKFDRATISPRDVLVIQDLFSDTNQFPTDIYSSLLKEMEATKINENRLWKSWHGDSHLIADDKLGWKKDCPVFTSIIQKVQDYFGMDVKATRFNWYRNNSEWKPFHHDAAAVKPDKAKTQNFTVGISFGAERDVAFEHAKNRAVISVPLPNGALYAFSKDVNVEWRHGILQIPPDAPKSDPEGRISIIAWGWLPTMTDK